MNKREFTTIEKGTTYELPVWAVMEGKGIVKLTQPVQRIQFVRGSKLKDEDVEKRDGILHETLLSILIEDLVYKNELVPHRHNSLAITNLQQALHWMEERQRERESRDVVGTYQK